MRDFQDPFALWYFRLVPKIPILILLCFLKDEVPMGTLCIVYFFFSLPILVKIARETNFLTLVGLVSILDMGLRVFLINSVLPFS